MNKVEGLPLSRIDAPPSSYSNPSTTSAPLSGQNPRQIIFVHKIFLLALLPSTAGHGPDIFLLVLCQHKLISPPTFPASIPRTCPLLIRPPAYRLRDAKYIPLVVPLHVGLQMQLHFSLLIGRTAHTCQCWLSASWAELFVHFFGSMEAAMAAENSLLELGDTLAGAWGEKVQVHLEEDILYCKVAGYGCDL